MKLKTIRNIDYCLGVILCFIFTLINDLSCLFMRSRKKSFPVECVLFVKLSELGSIILSHPLIKKVKTKYPSARIMFLTFKENSEILDILEIASKENTVVLRNDSFIVFSFDLLKAVLRLRRENIDLLFDLEMFSRVSALIGYIIKPKKGVGFYNYAYEGLYRGDFLTNKVLYNPLLHISKSFFALNFAAKAEFKNTPEVEEKIDDNDLSIPKVVFLDSEIEKFIRKFKLDSFIKNEKMILLSLGDGNIPLREWPLDYFVGIANKFIAKNVKIGLVGGKGAVKKANLFVNTIKPNECFNFTGLTTTKDLLMLFNIANLLITNDSGMAHLASLTSIRKIVFFGPESPQVFSPLDNNTEIFYSGLLCSPCFSVLNHRQSKCRDNKCLKAISPEMVYASAAKIINI